jgi:nicotinamidase-related amidase
MRLEADNSFLAVVDLQTRIVPAIDGGDGVVDNCRWLTELGVELEIPILFTTQYAQGLGPLVPEVSRLKSAHPVFEKKTFSAMRDPAFGAHVVRLERRQAVICGIESHVCVLQTALDLLEQDFDVFVVEDAVSSRSTRNKELALARLAQSGAQLVSREMVFFEWFGADTDPRFKSFVRRFVR